MPAALPSAAMESSVDGLAGQRFGQRRDDVERHREHDGRSFVAGNIGERLQVAQLHRFWLFRQLLCCL